MSNPAIDRVVISSLVEGLNSGARMLTDMTGVKFEPAPISGVLLPAKQPPPSFQDTVSIAASLSFGGDIAGGAALMLTTVDASRLAQGLMRSPSAPEAAMLASAIEEAANVVAHDALAPLAREIGVALMMAPPRSLEGPLQRIWTDMLDGLSPHAPPAAVYTATLGGLSGSCRVQFVLVLGPDFERRVESLRSSVRIEVGLGELHTGAAPAVLRAASLGSCVAVVIYDPATKTGAMSHVVMPTAGTPDKALAMPGKFADAAVPALLKKFSAPPSRLQAWMAGGANMFYGGASPLLQVGQRNVEGVRNALRAHGIIAVEDVGKNLGRTVELFTGSGEVWVRSGNVNQRLPTPSRKTRQPRLPNS